MLGIDERIDLFVIMDNSNQVDKNSLSLLKIYAKGIIDEYQFGVNKTHGSLITYSNQPDILLNLNDGIDKNGLKKLIDSVSQDKKNLPRLDRALNKVSELLVSRLSQADRDVPASVLILSRGKAVVMVFV